MKKSKAKNPAPSSRAKTDKVQKPPAGIPLKQNLVLRFCPLFIILLLGILSYSNTLHSPFIFDDIPNIVERTQLHLDSFSSGELAQLKHGLRGNRPLVMLSFALNYYWGKLNPFGYHLVNLFIHLVSAILVYLFWKSTLNLPSLQERYGKLSTQIALLSSLLFVVHPVQTQAVTYIVQRMASMATLFFLLALYCYHKARLHKGRRQIAYFAGTGLATLLALKSKEIAATLPLFIILYEYTLWPQSERDSTKKSLPYIVIGLLLVVGILVGVGYTGSSFTAWLNKRYQRYSFTPGQRMLTQLRVVVYYISLLFYPHPSRLKLDYDFPLSYSLLNPPTTLLCLLLILALLGLAFYLIKKRPVISFCIFWFFGNLAIESSFLPIELVYEHRLYLPSVGFFGLISILLLTGIEGLKAQPPTKLGLKAGVILALVVPLTIMTYQRNTVWQDRASLWQDAVDKSPLKPRPHYNLGNVYAQRQDYDRAIPYYLEAIKLKPDYAKAHNNLGFCYFFKGNIQKAMAETQIALRHKPTLVDAYFNMGTYYSNLGQLTLARDEFKKALKINSKHQKTILALKEIEKELGKAN